MRGQQRFLFATTLSLSLLLGQAPARAVVGAGSCVTGVDPCLSNTGDISKNACNGDHACASNTGPVSKNACTGVNACNGNTGDIGNGACTGVAACFENTGLISLNACRGALACENNSGSLGDGACFDNTGPVGHDACNGVNACNGNTGPVGKNACDGELACPFTLSAAQAKSKGERARQLGRANPAIVRAPTLSSGEVRQSPADSRRLENTIAHQHCIHFASQRRILTGCADFLQGNERLSRRDGGGERFDLRQI